MSNRAAPSRPGGWGREPRIPLFLAAPGTMLHVYAKHLFTQDEACRVVSHPRMGLPPSARERPRFVLADVASGDRPGWYGRLRQLRLRWPHTPIGVVVAASGGVVAEAEAYTAGANAVFTNLDPLEQVYDDLDRVAVAMTLPERKAQILIGYSSGLDQASLAGVLYIGTETVKSHTSEMFQQLSAKSKPMLVQQSFLGGLFEHPEPSSEADSVFPLTPMEAVTALTIGRTGSQQAAAEVLGRSAFTLKTHTRNVRRRVGWTVSESIAAVWRWGQQGNYVEHLQDAPAA